MSSFYLSQPTVCHGVKKNTTHEYKTNCYEACQRFQSSAHALHIKYMFREVVLDV